MDRDAFESGTRASMSGRGHDANPHEVGTDAHASWLAGWDAGGGLRPAGPGGAATLTIDAPVDGHVHFRDGPVLGAVVGFTAQHFRAALVMPNRPAIRTAADAVAYRDRIEAAARRAGHPGFDPLMTIALTDETTPGEIVEAAALRASHGLVAAKLYPIAADGRAATTGPEGGAPLGVADPTGRHMRPAYAAMVDCGMVLSIHAEQPPPCLRLDREIAYIPVLRTIRRQHPGLKICIEHISDHRMLGFVLDDDRAFGTITLHHLVDLVDDALEDVHHKCNPVPKHTYDREMLWSAIAAGYEKFGFGSDSAPHDVEKKHCAVPACGCFTAPMLLPRLAEAFERRGLLHRLEAFVAHHWPDFYGVARYAGKVTLVRHPAHVPVMVRYGLPPAAHGAIVVWRGGDGVGWDVANPDENSGGP